MKLDSKSVERTTGRIVVSVIRNAWKSKDENDQMLLSTVINNPAILDDKIFKRVWVQYRLLSRNIPIMLYKIFEFAPSMTRRFLLTEYNITVTEEKEEHLTYRLHYNGRVIDEITVHDKPIMVRNPFIPVELPVDNEIGIVL